MCTGIRDVANLGWKLNAVLRWQAPDSLFDSYERERRAHTRTYIETAVRVGEMMNSAQTADALTHAIRPDGAAQMNSISRDLDHAIGPDGDAMRGIRMSQPHLADGKLLGDAMQGRLAVIGGMDVLNGATLPPEDVALVIDPDQHPEVAGMLRALDLDAAVIRPDFYCFGALASSAGGAMGGVLDALHAQAHG